MKSIQTKLALFTIIALSPLASIAQIYDTNGDFVQTFAGSGFSGYLDGVGQLTMFNNPNAIVADSHSNLFVWDSGNYRIREIAPNGTVTTFAGGGNQLPGVGTNAYLYNLAVTGMAIDQNNTIWLTANYDNIYKVTSNASVTIAFTYQSFPPSTTGQNGICFDSFGNMYISTGDNRIYRYANGVFSVFAGSGDEGYVDGQGVFSDFNGPAALACDQANNIYVWDSGNQLIRRIDQNQNVTTFAGKYAPGVSGWNPNADGTGTNAVFGPVYEMCFDNSGNLYLACGESIRKMDAQTNVVTMAGSFTQNGYTNGAGNLARFSGADGVCLSGGTIYIADSDNQRIRDIIFNPQPQIVSGANLGIGTYAGVTITGIVGRTYQIQSSPDLSTWTTRATVLLTSSPYLWIDQNPVNRNQFYRALLLP